MMAVSHPTEITTGTDTISIAVTMEGTGLVKTMVCVMMESDSVYEVGLTDSTGSASLIVSPQSPGEMLLTVTCQNARPYESVIIVNPPTVPPAITDLIAVVEQHDIYLSWSPCSCAVEYHIYRSPEPDFEPHPDLLVAATEYSHYRDPDVILSNQQFFYRIVAVSE
jgi:hypothetical protein